jgi:hypothetical protein
LWHQVHKQGLHTSQTSAWELGRLEYGYKFSQNSDVASSSKWKNDALSISTSPCGLVAWMLVFHLEVTGSIPAASIYFSTGLTILALLSSS